MKLPRKWADVTVVLSLVCAIADGFISGCYNGVADSETVQIVQTQFGSPNRVAMLVRRSDRAALSGDTFLIFISDHVYSLPELRKRLYALPPVFVTGRDGIALRWSAPNELTIQCRGCDITKDAIENAKVFREWRCYPIYWISMKGEGGTVYSLRARLHSA